MIEIGRNKGRRPSPQEMGECDGLGDGRLGWGSLRCRCLGGVTLAELKQLQGEQTIRGGGFLDVFVYEDESIRFSFVQ